VKDSQGVSFDVGLRLTVLDIVNYDVRLRDNYDGRRIDSPKLQLPLTCCLA
jgi:hypothetical protein